MKHEISKQRMRRVHLWRRNRKNKEQVPFRNGTLLASIYLVITILTAIGLEFVSHLFTEIPTHEDIPYVLGCDLVILSIAAYCARLLLGRLAPEVIARNSRILMLCLVAVFENSLHTAVLCLASKALPLLTFLPDGFSPQDFVPPLIPYLFAPALCTLLAGPGVGIAMGIALAIQNLIFVGSGSGFQAVAVGSVISLAAPLCLAGVRNRTGLYRNLFLIGLLQLLGILIHAFLWCIEKPQIADLGLGQSLRIAAEADAILTVVSIAVASVAVTLLLPIFEHVFGVSSNLRLTQYGDLGHPLLTRLQREASGTANHSQNVAIMAADAAERIGANVTLARVGSYYHDVGKVLAPQRFTENQGEGTVNPHDSQRPSMSALVIAAHVKDGLGFAKDFHLPIPIRDIIVQHHGTTRMEYFYRKALEQEAIRAEATGEDPRPIDESQFRYGGPKPQTAEAVIVMLADSIEAAAKSNKVFTPGGIEKLVEKIVADKIADGQLDEAPVTLGDIVELKKSFTASLTTIHRGRIAYPKADPEKDGKNQESDKETPPHDENTERRDATPEARP